jgi:hypothetical protein
VGEKDSDGDGISDAEDADDDGDGIPDAQDNDDDNDGIADEDELIGRQGCGVDPLPCLHFSPVKPTECVCLLEVL